MQLSSESLRKLRNIYWIIKFDNKIWCAIYYAIFLRMIPKIMTDDITGHCALTTSLITSLLLENCDGKMYDRRQKRFSAKIKVFLFNTCLEE